MKLYKLAVELHDGFGTLEYKGSVALPDCANRGFVQHALAALEIFQPDDAHVYWNLTTAYPLCEVYLTHGALLCRLLPHEEMRMTP